MLMINHNWTITGTDGSVITSTDESPAAINLDDIALNQNSGGCGIFPVGFTAVDEITNNCGGFDSAEFNISRCYVFGPDGTVLICDGEPFCFDVGACGCE